MTRRLLVLALALALAAPAGATWSVPGSTSWSARAAVLAPVPEPSVTARCLSSTSLGLTVSWTATDPNVTGYELWRTSDGTTALVTTTDPRTTSATDTQPVGVTLAYYVVSRAGSWRAKSPTHRVSGLPVCA